MKLILKVISGPLKGETFSFKEYKKISIGRSAKCYFSFPDDPKISRVHCLIELLPPSNVFVKDMGSRNGTYYAPSAVENEKLSFKKFDEKNLASGDFLRVGKTIVRVYFKGVKEADFNSKKETFSSWDKFKILGKIGEGNIGTVHLAEDQSSQKQVALKIAYPRVAPREEQIKSFLQKVKLCSELNHPNLVKYQNGGYCKEGYFYIPMEYIEGESLNSYLKKQSSPLSLTESKNIIEQILGGLEYLHYNRVIHRDLKSANVLLVKKNNKICVKLTDFGVAKKYENEGFSGLTLSADSMKEMDYLSPEELSDTENVTEQVDIYSIGVLIYNMLTLKGIYKENNKSMSLKIIAEEPVPIRERNAAIPERLGQIIMKCLQKEPKGRPQSVKVLKDYLLDELDEVVLL